MNFHDMPRGACISKPRAHRHLGPGPCGQRRLSRRQFARTAVSAVVVGATLGSGVWRPGLVQGRQPHAPVPISEGGFMGMRVFGPPQEISTITDFNGFVGIAIINGTMTKINMATGEIRTLPFLQADMRFMTGFFRDTAGQVVQGAFAFI
jgi:hypothetical protein